MKMRFCDSAGNFFPESWHSNGHGMPLRLEYEFLPFQNSITGILLVTHKVSEYGYQYSIDCILSSSHDFKFTIEVI